MKAKINMSSCNYESKNKYAIIDVGSNSVRLLLWKEGKSIVKEGQITRLAAGLQQNKILTVEAIERTVQAISLFCHRAKELAYRNIYIFATEAVRSSQNNMQFIESVKMKTGYTVDILTGEEEAECGLLGCLQNKAGGIIDIGGASTEIIVADGKRKIYAKSLPIGAVRLYDSCKKDRMQLEACIKSQIALYGDVPKAEFYAIGGTATALTALVYQIVPYDSVKVHGKILMQATVQEWADKLLRLSYIESLALVGMDKARADVLPGAVFLLSSIMQMLQIEQITVSEQDNLEGYIFKFLLQNKDNL